MIYLFWQCRHPRKGAVRAVPEARARGQLGANVVALVWHHFGPAPGDRLRLLCHWPADSFCAAIESRLQCTCPFAVCRLTSRNAAKFSPGAYSALSVSLFEHIQVHKQHSRFFKILKLDEFEWNFQLDWNSFSCRFHTGVVEIIP